MMASFPSIQPHYNVLHLVEVQLLRNTHNNIIGNISNNPPIGTVPHSKSIRQAEVVEVDDGVFESMLVFLLTIFIFTGN